MKGIVMDHENAEMELDVTLTEEPAAVGDDERLTVEEPTELRAGQSGRDW
jgi:hypothetical protein